MLPLPVSTANHTHAFAQMWLVFMPKTTDRCDRIQIFMIYAFIAKTRFMNFKVVLFQELNWRTLLRGKEGDFRPRWSLVLLYHYRDFDQAGLWIFWRLSLHVCSSEAASLVLGINPAKLIMLLRGRWHHCEVSTTACQGSLCPYLNFVNFFSSTFPC